MIRTHALTDRMGGLLGPPILFVLLLAIFGEGGDSPPATFLIRLTLYAAVAVAIVRSPALSIKANVADLAILAFWVLGALSLARGGYRWISYQWFLHHTAAGALYLLARSVPPDDDRLARLAGKVVVATAVLQVALAAYQKVALLEDRPYGTLQNPNFLGEFLVYALVVAVAWKQTLAKEEGGFRRHLPWVVMALLLSGIALTVSRAAFLLVLAVGSILLSRRVGWKPVLVLVAAAGMAVMLFDNPLRDRFLGKGDPYAFERLNMWKASVRIFLDHPLGVGVGHYKYYWNIYRDPVEGSLIRYAKFARTPHNEFFSVLSELGVPGVVAFVALGVGGCVILRRAIAGRDAVATTCALVTAASFLHGGFDYNYHIFGILLMNALALGLVSGRLLHPVFRCEVPMGRPVKGLLLFLLAAMGLYAGLTCAGAALEERGRDAFKAGRLEEAAATFTRAAAIDPWRATFSDGASGVYYRLYETRSERERIFDAIDQSQEAFSRNPMDFRYPSRLGYLLSQAARVSGPPSSGRYLGAAFYYYDKAIRLNPHAADLRYLKAVLLRASGRREEALAMTRDIVREEPRYVKAWVLIGEILEQSSPAAAAEAYRTALSAHLENRGRAYEQFEKEFIGLNVNMTREMIRKLEAKPPQ